MATAPMTVGQKLFIPPVKGQEVPVSATSTTSTESTPEVATPQYGYKRSAPTGVVPESTASTALENYQEPVKASKLASVGAGMGGIAVNVFRGTRSALIYEREPNFDPEPLTNEFFAKVGGGSPEEVRYLADSKNSQDWQDRTEYVLDNRMRQQAIADNPISGVVGSLADVDLAVGALKIARVGNAATKLERAGERVSAGAVGAGAMYGVNSALGDNTLRTENEQMLDVMTMGLSRMVAPLAKAPVATTEVAQAAAKSATATTVPPAPRERVQDVQSAWDTAAEKAKAVTLTNAEIDALPKKGRGAARRALQAQKRADALAKVNAEYEPRLQAAKASQEAEEAAELQRLSNQTLDELDDLAQNPPTGTPAQQVAKHQIIAALQSTADELNYLTGGDTTTVVNKLYSNPAINNGDDVVSAQNVYWNNYNHKLSTVESALKDAVADITGVRGGFINRVTGKYAAATKSVSADFQEALQRLDADVIAFNKAQGRLPDSAEMDAMLTRYNNHPSLNKAIRTYIDSDFAVKVYDDAHASGLFMRKEVDAAGNEVMVNGMDDILRRPTYTPLRHSYDKIEDTINVRKVATRDEVADFIGAQIARMYPELLQPKNAAKTFVLTKRQIGQHFLQTQEDVSRSLADVTVTGMNKEQIADILTRTGNMTAKDARIVAADMFSEMHKKGTSVPKNLRRRIEWDWNAKMKTDSGYTLTMRDLVEDNAMGNLEDYARGMSHRIGLSDYGLKSETELVNLLESYLSKLPKGVDTKKAKQFMANTVDTLLGRAIERNPVPEGVRSAQAVADMFLLANSGLYGIMDLVTQMQKVGVIRSLPAIKQGMKAVFNDVSKFSQAEAKELEDILTGRLLAGSRWRNFSVRYADNFEVTAGIHEAAQHYGQSARFMNLSESIKRFQVGILTSVYANNLKKAMTGSAKDLEFMKSKLAIDDALLKGIQREYAKHGVDIDKWSNKVRVRYEQKLYHDADNLAMNVHRGEVPSILEFSPVGRVIFPYMRYAFGMQNKVLRRTLNRDGATGLAMLLALQIPTGMLIGAAINVRKGEEYDKDLGLMTVRSMSALGSLNYPMEIAMAGLEGGGITAFAPFSKTYNFGKELATGGADGEVSGTQLLKNSPLNAALPLDYLALALED